MKWAQKMEKKNGWKLQCGCKKNLVVVIVEMQFENYKIACSCTLHSKFYIRDVGIGKLPFKLLLIAYTQFNIFPRIKLLYDLNCMSV